MSLTSYRAAPPRGGGGGGGKGRGLGRPGGDLLFRALRRSTIGAEGFNGRVRDGIGCFAPRHDHQAVPAPARPRRQGRRGEGGRVVDDRGVFGGLPLVARRGEADRAISTGQLRGLPRFHLRPIDVVVCDGSRRDLVLRRVSRLDAFSGYPVRT